MPTNRRVRSRHRIAPGDIAPGLWGWLCGDEFDPQRHVGGRLETFTRPHADLWLAHRGAVVAWFALNRPGTRPPLFWAHEVGTDMPATPARQAAYLRRHGLLRPGELVDA